MKRVYRRLIRILLVIASLTFILASCEAYVITQIPAVAVIAHTGAQI